MGMVFGRIPVETPKYEVMQSKGEYEIRKYPPSVMAELTYDPSIFKGNKDGGFKVLVNYIGIFGNPQNTKPEKIEMTSPVITKSAAAEKIAMTSPVITKSAAAEKIAMTSPVITKSAAAEKIAMTSPVVTKEEGTGGDGAEKKMVTMQFFLPAKYTKAEEAPKPMDERVVIREEGERKYGVVKFSGVASEGVVEQKVGMLKNGLERDGFKVIGEFVLARYTPPSRTLPPFRTNEVMIPVE